MAVVILIFSFFDKDFYVFILAFKYPFGVDKTSTFTSIKRLKIEMADPNIKFVLILSFCLLVTASSLTSLDEAREENGNRLEERCK